MLVTRRGFSLALSRPSSSLFVRRQTNHYLINTRHRFFHSTIPNPTSETEVSENVREILEKMKKLQLLEVVQLGNELQKLVGATIPMIPIGQPVQNTTTTESAPAASAAPAAPAAPASEKPQAAQVTVADIKLIGYPEEKKFHLLKEIRKLKPGMNLMDSKKLVENLPQILQTKVAGDDLVEWKKALDALGDIQYELIG
eukprot:TRINITY_DN4763_c0_g1_i2.p1 TRINITY_DN4763_c0_g1~~TRINITY_DN4763_c0_g1_i2.p1  ORF type:complete len:199 (+),score=43.34 TRINITY_DN4763_c0_g1_i2:246-842(+)